MELYTIATILVILSALFGYLNVRFVKLPTTIGLMVIAIIFTFGIIVSSWFGSGLVERVQVVIVKLDFSHLLLDFMLGFLLFAGALHTNFEQLKVQRWPILVFATIGVFISTLIVGFLSFHLFNVLGLDVSFIHCLLFGALISPTDPIAVLGILKQAGVPKKLETKIVGESLFNDGVGVVLFLTILSFAGGGPGHSNNEISDILTLFGQEIFGGLITGAALGYITFLLMRSIDDYEVEVLITLACVMGGYALGHFLHVSAPLAMVVAGLIIGNDTMRGTAMSEITETYVDKFWELVDLLLNAVLFVLIGLEILLITFEQEYIYAGLLTIVLVLFARFASLSLPIQFFRKKLKFIPNTTAIMVWGGLRGGISIALALSLPESMNRDLFLTVTYIVVFFSIVVQGLTIEKLAERLIGSQSNKS